MKKLFPLILLVAMTQHVQTQAGITGYWRVASVVPDGTPDGAVLQFALELKADGTSVTGTATGIPLVINQGRIEGTSVTVNGVDTNTKQPVSLTGNLSGSFTWSCDRGRVAGTLLLAPTATAQIQEFKIAIKAP